MGTNQTGDDLLRYVVVMYNKNKPTLEEDQETHSSIWKQARIQIQEQIMMRMENHTIGCEHQ